VIALFETPTRGQTFTVQPVHVAAGTVLTFHIQSRLNPSSRNAIDALPKGTVLRVKILDPIDSTTERDGSEFRGVVVSSVVSGVETVLRSDSKASVLLALLRDRNHPEGFRYELFVTNVRDHGKSFDLTASVDDPSLLDNSLPPPAASDPRMGGAARVNPPGHSLEKAPN
jgi:hypothetical protein